jgi:hypothetical protein
VHWFSNTLSIEFVEVLMAIRLAPLGHRIHRDVSIFIWLETQADEKHRCWRITDSLGILRSEKITESTVFLPINVSLWAKKDRVAVV